MKYDYNKGSAKSAISFFKEIPNHPRYYANFQGNIYSARRRKLKMLKPTMVPNGYLCVKLYDDFGNLKKRYVHQLVLEALVGPRPDGMLACDTPDPRKTVNRLDNLAWQTRFENAADSLRDGTYGAYRRSLDADQVREIRRLCRDGMINVALSRRFGIGPDNVRLIVRGETWAWLDTDIQD